MSVKITDLVDQSALDQLATLKTRMDEVLQKYQSVATDLAKGLDIQVKVTGDIDKLDQLLVNKTKEATEANKQLTNVVQQQGQVIANTTNTISRQLMEQEKVNKASREAYTEQGKVKEILEKLNGTYQEHLKTYTSVNESIKANKKAQDDLKKEYKDGKVSADEYKNTLIQLTAEERELKQQKADLNTLMKNEEREAASVEGSYRQLSQQLELLKKGYKDLSEEERQSAMGTELESAIQNLDAHLKDMSADMGEFQRNVGNYAIAGRDGVVSTDSLTSAMQQEAKTTQDLIDQTKILEEGKQLLNKNDVNYQSTLAAVNAKLEENKRKLSDVSDILHKDATSVAEAEAQNKRLQEALKRVDLTSADAKEKIAQLNAKIAKNTQIIRENTPAIQDETKAMQQMSKANEGAANQLLSLVGINNNFGSSLQMLGQSNAGSVMEGLTTKVKAFGSTLTGLLSNPWVLTFLGIAGVAAGVKWWYDYNKGLVEATKLTKEFTGKTGDDLKNFRSEVQGVADTFGKDFQEVLKTADALAANFGISFEEALQTVKDGFISGADANGDMLSKLSQYPAYFHEAGMSAQEFTAIVSQTKSGIFGDKGLDAIKMATERIRRMPAATAEALDSIGLSSQEIQKGLTEGTISIMDVIQQVSGKLKELPDDSQQVGEVLKEVFGKKGADAGLAMIRSLEDIKTDLGEVKEETGTLGELQEQQMESQIELDKTLAAVFDQTGGNFEKLTTQCKVFINQGIVNIIKGAVDIVNWFIRMYNKSILVRGSVQSIANAFKNMWAIAKFILKHVVDSFKGLGEVIEGVVTLDFDKIKEGWTKGFKALGSDLKGLFAQIKNNTELAIFNTLDDQMDEVSIDLNANLNPNNIPTIITNNGNNDDNNDDNNNNNDDKKGGGSDSKAAERQRKEAEKHAQELLKIINETEEAKVNAMEEGHDKELALIRLKYKKKLDEIKGESEEEQQLRTTLALAMEQEIAASDLKYQQNLAKINLENRLATVEEGSEEEKDLRLAQLEAQHNAEVEAAKRTGADVNLINQKFAKERAKIELEYETNKYNKMADERQGEYERKQAELKKQYATELALAGTNAEKRKRATAKYESELAKLSEDYARETAQKEIEFLETLLKNEQLTDEQRAQLRKQLADAKITLANTEADADIKASDDAAQADEDDWERRKENASKWMQKVAEALNAINDLAQAIYDGKIQQIEDEQDALDEASEEEQDRISDLVDKKVISEEEGEARKRAAEAKTAKKTEELEKKKAALEYKQAVWDKANSLAQAGIATALAITQALPNVVLAALAGAMGAIQVATILATPIPQYAKGTAYHKGGAAIVGDGGQPEIISYDGQSWVTPSKPTIVDLPKGASVMPSLDKYLLDNPGLVVSPISDKSAPVIINNDYAKLEQGLNTLVSLIKRQTHQQHLDSYQAQYELFKRTRL
jgi:hypothetical protein